jgi:hypothetical protein
MNPFKAYSKVQDTIFKTLVLAGVGGTAVLGFMIYNGTVKNAQDAQQFLTHGYNSVAKVTHDLATNSKINRTPTVSLDLIKVTSHIDLTSLLKVAEISCEQEVTVSQTGRRDLFVLGYFLEGKAEIKIVSGFTGSVEYNLSEVKIRLEKDKIIVDLPPPIVKLTEVKNMETSASGDLDNLIAARQQVIQVLNSALVLPYQYKLFFADEKTTELFTVSHNQATHALTDLIQATVKATQPNITETYKIVVNPSTEPTKSVTITTSKKNDVQIPLASIFNANDTAITNLLKSTNSSAIVTSKLKNSEVKKTNLNNSNLLPD